MKIKIIDFGLGNIYSVYKALKLACNDVEIINTPNKIEKESILVLPGVGSFKEGMSNLTLLGFKQPIIDHAKNGYQIIGICLGMQLLFSKGTEGGDIEGLGIIDGNVKKLPFEYKKNKIKVPHIGWNSVELKLNPRKYNAYLDIFQSDFYFVHSFFCEPRNKDVILTTTKHNGFPFVSAVKYKNCIGVQFHPEKSGPTGIELIHSLINETIV